MHRQQAASRTKANVNSEACENGQLLVDLLGDPPLDVDAAALPSRLHEPEELTMAAAFSSESWMEVSYAASSPLSQGNIRAVTTAMTAQLHHEPPPPPLNVNVDAAFLSHFWADATIGSSISMETTLLNEMLNVETTPPSQLWTLVQRTGGSPLPRTLDELEAMARNQSLASALPQGGSVITVQVLLEKLGQCAALAQIANVTELQSRVWALLPQIFQQAERAAVVQIVEKTTVLGVMLLTIKLQNSGLTVTQGRPLFFFQALECVAVLQQRGITFYHSQQHREIVRAVVTSIPNAAIVDDLATLKLILQTLKAFRTEGLACAEEINRLTAVSLASMKKHQTLRFLRALLETRSPQGRLASQRDKEVKWKVFSHFNVVFDTLKRGVSFERLIAMEALLRTFTAKRKAGARRFVVEGGIKFLVALTQGVGAPVRDKATALLNAISKTNEQYLGGLITT
ncbi:hypothetical protein Gpo141_00010782 [Globisporangium polare]